MRWRLAFGAALFALLSWSWAARAADVVDLHIVGRADPGFTGFIFPGSGANISTDFSGNTVTATFRIDDADTAPFIKSFMITLGSEPGFLTQDGGIFDFHPEFDTNFGYDFTLNLSPDGANITADVGINLAVRTDGGTNLKLNFDLGQPFDLLTPFLDNSATGSGSDRSIVDAQNLGEFLESRGTFTILSVSSTVNGHGPIASVPEPASWALMIVGFGAAGVALRGCRRRVAG